MEFFIFKANLQGAPSVQKGSCSPEIMICKNLAMYAVTFLLENFVFF